MSEERIVISLRDEEKLKKLIDNGVKEPMRRKMTGIVIIHMLDGVIRGYEMNPKIGHIDRLNKLWGLK